MNFVIFLLNFDEFLSEFHEELQKIADIRSAIPTDRYYHIIITFSMTHSSLMLIALTFEVSWLEISVALAQPLRQVE